MICPAYADSVDRSDDARLHLDQRWAIAELANLSEETKLLLLHGDFQIECNDLLAEDGIIPP